MRQIAVSRFPLSDLPTRPLMEQPHSDLRMYMRNCLKVVMWNHIAEVGSSAVEMFTQALKTARCKPWKQTASP
jgi:hypothetical protein